MNPTGWLRVVGLGPGGAAQMTAEAEAVLRAAQVVVGYTRYVALVPGEWIPRAEVISTGMTQEMDRCAQALELAVRGKRVALVSSGDAGVYGMAGLAYELAHEQGLLERGLDLGVVPGVPAVVAAAALAGAPLTHDFACVSLSDLMTPWELIERRLMAVAAADFVLAIYNPRSKRRDWQLPRALDILREHRDARTPVALVRQAYRPAQEMHLFTLHDVDPTAVDMLSILLVGNAATRIIAGRMVTPRGYLDKYGLPGAPGRTT